MRAASVSIIIPVFNREDTIVETLSSVSRQTYTDWECLIVDDGSTDGTIASIEAFIRSDIRFRLYIRDSPVKGAPECRNTGFKRSVGKFLLFLDSDDLLTPGYLNSQVDKLNASGDGAVVSRIFRFSFDINDHKPWYSAYSTINLLDFLNGKCSWRTSAVVWARAAYARTGGFDTRLKMWQDWVLYIKYFAVSGTFSVNEQAVVYYREGWSSAQITTTAKKSTVAEAYFLSRQLAFKMLFRKMVFSKEIRRALSRDFFFTKEQANTIGKRLKASFQLLFLTSDIGVFLRFFLNKLNKAK